MCYLLWIRCQSKRQEGWKEMRPPQSLNRLNRRPSRTHGPSRGNRQPTWWAYLSPSTIVLLLGNWMILACLLWYFAWCSMQQRLDKGKIKNVLAVTAHSLSMSELWHGKCPLSDIHLPLAWHGHLGQSHCQSTIMEQHNAWGQSSIFIQNSTSSSHYCRLVACQTLKDKSHTCFVTFFEFMRV